MSHGLLFILGKLFCNWRKEIEMIITEADKIELKKLIAQEFINIINDGDTQLDVYEMVWEKMNTRLSDQVIDNDENDADMTKVANEIYDLIHGRVKKLIENIIKYG